jgi:hypothetical protein
MLAVQHFFLSVFEVVTATTQHSANMRRLQAILAFCLTIAPVLSLPALPGPRSVSTKPDFARDVNSANNRQECHCLGGRWVCCNEGGSCSYAGACPE